MSKTSVLQPNVGFISTSVLGDAIYAESRKKNENSAFEKRMKAYGKAYSDFKKKGV